LLPGPPSSPAIVIGTRQEVSDFDWTWPGMNVRD
jgi:hypothetical protein